MWCLTSIGRTLHGREQPIIIFCTCRIIGLTIGFAGVQESLPLEYAKIFAFDSFARTQKTVFAKAKEIESGTDEGCFPAGSFVRLHLLQVPASKVEPLLKSYKTNPVVVCGLLQHESKMSVLHFRYCFRPSLFSSIGIYHLTTVRCACSGLHRVYISFNTWCVLFLLGA